MTKNDCSTSHSAEYRALNQRSKWVSIRCRSKAIFDENGSPVLFTGITSNLNLKK